MLLAARSYSVGTRAAWMVDPESEVITSAEGDEEARKMARMLEAIGFRHIRGYLTGGIIGWCAVKLGVEMTSVLNIPTLAERLERDEVILLDVRDAGEWEAGHVEGSVHFPYWRLRDEARRRSGTPKSRWQLPAPAASAAPWPLPLLTSGREEVFPATHLLLVA